ncbi:hypothetical protein MLD38_008576 [Melastoma candidum]|uniref:Uncharacterized protein n=1 Tax=Melastoma candidum TaxID=119954 RepID=A0ACB9RZ21_9MYRT|nr:hypothetical protein MLD38_008576 [Melastoma candidum]
MPSLSEMSDVFFKSIEGDDDDKGTKWAILVAASPDLEANVCEAYQIMKNRGLNDDNILVFRDVEDDADDMPSHGVIPDEPIPVDYTTTPATIHRILKAALLPDATPLVSGSGKLLESCSDDHIFLYYVSHDPNGLLRPMRVAEKAVTNELTFILGEMDTKRRYKSMVVYVEADSSLSEGSLPSDIRIYARTFADHHGNVYRRVGDFPTNKDRFEGLTGTTLTEERPTSVTHIKYSNVADDNIIAFMYDDIANSPRNPSRGTLINAPNGPDVYKGVPKDYTQGAATLSNFLAVLGGQKGNTRGGSCKVLTTGPNDRIFFYYSGHGSKDKIGFPDGKFITSLTLKLTLMSMHSSRSFGHYCWLPKYDEICLGEKYSVSWMEDSDVNDPATETLGQQFEKDQYVNGDAVWRHNYVQPASFGEELLDLSFSVE